MPCPQVTLSLSLGADSCREVPSLCRATTFAHVEMAESLVAVTNLRLRSGAGPRLRLIWPTAAARGVLPDDARVAALECK